jgi:hypothetical protein
MKHGDVKSPGERAHDGFYENYPHGHIEWPKLDLDTRKRWEQAAKGVRARKPKVVVPKSYRYYVTNCGPGSKVEVVRVSVEVFRNGSRFHTDAGVRVYPSFTYTTPKKAISGFIKRYSAMARDRRQGAVRLDRLIARARLLGQK